MTARRALAAFFLTAIVVLASLPSVAAAKTVTPYKFAREIDGSSSTDGTFGGLEFLAFDTADEELYTKERGNEGGISRFKPDGSAAPFSALGASSFASGFQGFNEAGQLAVDNSPGSVGRFFFVPETGESGGPEAISGWENSGAVAPGFPIHGLRRACGVATDPQGNIWYSDYGASRLFQLDPQGNPTGREITVGFQPPCQLAIDPSENFYVVSYSVLTKFGPGGNALYRLELGEQRARGVAVDPSNGDVFVSVGGPRILEFGPDSPEPILEIGKAEGSFPGLGEASSIAVDGKTHEVYVVAHESIVDVFKPAAPIVVPTVVTGTAVPTPTTAQLRGTVDPDGVATTSCFFRWGTERAQLNETVPCDQAGPLTGSGAVSVTATINGLTKGNTYYFELFSENATGFESHGKIEALVAQGVPLLSGEFANDVTTDSAFVHAAVDPEAGKTSVQVEYGTTTSYGSVAPLPAVALNSTTAVAEASVQIPGLTPDTLYHYRLIATNAAGVRVSSADHFFKTFSPVTIAEDRCPNALARQQTGAALLLDCRAFELVSAADSGGYNVESDLVPGQEPFDGFPLADGKVLYSTHNGGIPNSGSPTNNGRDPYVATRGATGWTTSYIGIPAAGTPSSAPFGSPVSGADGGLDTFAFGGEELCAPCFANGSTGVPIRRADGSLEQGMAGDLDPGPGALADGHVATPLSADGSHLVFGSTSAFEPGANDGTGDVSLYERDLTTGVTQVISKTPSGANLACLQGAGSCHSPGDGNGIGELAISRDGSHVLVAQKVSTDADGNVYWHLYMHVGSSPTTIDLTPGAKLGALFDGMSADGSTVFLTTRDRLLPADTDSSADIYEASVGAGGATLRLVSTKSDGTPSNSDACAPPTNWNAVSGGPNCDAVAFAGGAGLAAGAGAFYFVSPEQLEPGAGVADQVNLYVSRPGGAPRFVALMDSTAGKPGPQPPSWSLSNSAFLAGLNSPGKMVFDSETGGFYLQETGNRTINRYKGNGAKDNYTAGTGAGTNKFKYEIQGGTETAVDNDPTSPLRGDFFVPQPVAQPYPNETVGVSIFAHSGEELGKIEPPPPLGGGEASTCGVAVEQSTGAIYIAESSRNSIKRLVLKSGATAPYSYASFAVTSIQPKGLYPCQLATDRDGHVYVVSQGQAVERFEASQFTAVEPEVEGTPFAAVATAISVDQTTGDVFVDTGSAIQQYGESGTLKEEFGQGLLSSSSGVAVAPSSDLVLATTATRVLSFTYGEHPYRPIDNPAIVHAVENSATHDYGDFQVTDDGRYAAFASGVPLTGFENAGRLEVFRYDTASGGALVCVSCTPSNARPTADSSLASHGLSLLGDGRLFFNSPDPLALHDTNGEQDVYEYENGSSQLVSTGASGFPSSLLSASADGRDVYFFTQDALASGDANGSLVRIYDAREGGGFFAIPESPPCAASDECHGAGSPVPPTPQIGSLAAKPPAPKCAKGKVRHEGRCVKRPSHKKHKKHKTKKPKKHRKHHGAKSGSRAGNRSDRRG